MVNHKFIRNTLDGKYLQHLLEEGLMQFLSNSMPVKEDQIVEEENVGGNGVQWN